MRIFERLRDEDSDDGGQGEGGRYQGAYDSVRRFVKKHRESKRETFIPLDHDPGQRVEADFGEIHVDFPDGRRKVNVLILVWSYSNAPFAIALPTQRTEAILEGMTQAFEFFDCVPKEVWWDNPRTVADAVLKGRERKVNARYAALASHFAFEPAEGGLLRTAGCCHLHVVSHFRIGKQSRRAGSVFRPVAMKSQWLKIV